MTSPQFEEGSVLPPFELKSSLGGTLTTNDILSKNILFFIYSKNDTNSCTKEAQSYSDYKQLFLKSGVDVVGISKDSIKSHKKFVNKYSLKLELLSDESLEFISSIGSWVEKTMYGKKYMGVERTTILIGKGGKVLKVWRKFRVSGHVPEVLKFIKQNFSNIKS